MSLIQPSEEHEIIEHSVSQLARKYAGKFDASEIRPVVQESYMGFADARVRTFIPVFTTRYADDRLRAMAKVRGLINDALPSVLFVCTHNSARSQLAAGIWRRLTGEPARSAGTEPADCIHPIALETARRHRINLGDARPNLVTPRLLHGATVITVCDQAHDDLARAMSRGSNRPMSRLHWSVPDPVANGTKQAFERAFEDLADRISPLASLANGTTNDTQGGMQ